MKKLSVWLALILALTGTALAETAATPTIERGDYTYILLADGTAQIVCWQGEETGLVIPAQLDGITVTSISECAFADCDALESVSVPATVTEIGENAFEDCAALERVDLADGLLRVGDAAFKGCESLTEIAMPDTVREVGVNPFLGCANMNDIFVSPDSDYLATINGVLFSKPDKRLICYPMGLLAEYYEVPQGIRTIGERAFDRGLCLEQVVLPQSLVCIERQAFNGCEGLRSMNLPASVTTIGEDAVKCSNLVLTIEGEPDSQQFAQGEGPADEA